MRKEVLFAIIIGLILGLMLTYGLYTANKAADSVDTSTTAPSDSTSTPSPTPSSQSSLFTITSPQDGDIFSTDTATISGQVSTPVTFVILTENDEIVVTPDAQNRFKQTIKLVSGANLIQVSAFTVDGQRQDQDLNLVYTTAKLESN